MRLLSTLLLAALGASCISEDKLLFATNSSIGLDVDSKPPTVSIAFSRQEGSVGPVTDKGEVLPLVTSFSGGAGVTGALFGANVAQSFAVGNAAWVLSKYLMDPATRVGDNEALPDKLFTSAAATAVDGVADERYFFATVTTLGLRVGLSPTTGALPDALSFGWKRKELAYVPTQKIGEEGSAQLVVAPMIATTAGSAGSSNNNAESALTQLYATGHASTWLAADPHVRGSLGLRILGDEGLEAEREAIEKDIETGAALAARTSELIEQLDEQGLLNMYWTASGMELISWDEDAWNGLSTDERTETLRTMATDAGKSGSDSIRKLRVLNHVIEQRLEEG